MYSAVKDEVKKIRNRYLKKQTKKKHLLYQKNQKVVKF